MESLRRRFNTIKKRRTDTGVERAPHSSTGKRQRLHDLVLRLKLTVGIWTVEDEELSVFSGRLCESKWSKCHNVCKIQRSYKWSWGNLWTNSTYIHVPRFISRKTEVLLVQWLWGRLSRGDRPGLKKSFFNSILNPNIWCLYAFTFPCHFRRSSVYDFLDEFIKKILVFPLIYGIRTTFGRICRQAVPT